MDMKSLLERIDKRLEAVRLTAAEASRSATGSPDTIRNWKRAAKDGKTAGASHTTLGPIASVLKTNVQWLTEGVEPEEGEAGGLHDAPTAIEAPLLSWVSAGQLSSDDASDEAIGTAKAVLPPGDWVALRVEGESMDRISPPGSIIFVDRADKRLVTGGFYVIADGEGHSTYKRFQARPMRFEPVSKNKSLPALYPDNEPTIVGRVKLTTLDLT
jgi:SOS-response transcriptional repressor LexA